LTNLYIIAKLLKEEEIFITFVLLQLK